TFLLANARFVADAVQHPVPFNPQSLGPGVNSTFSEYFPSVTADGSTLIFTRNDNGDENFYQSAWKDNAWQPAEPLKGVNTRENEGAQAISSDGSWIAFTACDRRSDGSQGGCDLYWSQQKADGWSTASPFSATINSASWEAQPTISANGRTIIFSSNRPGGRGKIDLWQTTRQANGKWTKPENLGPLLNSGGDDQTPFLHPDDQTLYFSSDSLPGMGGKDIYFSRRQADGSWGPPQNLGYPINTKGEDVMLTVSLDGRTAYYATNRPGGQGRLDIYSFELPEYARPKPVTYARAKVADAFSGYPIVAKVDFIDLKTGQSYASAYTKKDGTALVCLPAGTDYALNVSKDKYLFYSENFNLLESATFDQPFTLNIELQPISIDSSAAAGKPIVLRNVFFEVGSAELRPESATELDRLATLLTENPQLRIELDGHTDNVGDSRSNLILSENRALSVLNYLVKKGVDTSRLRSKGFADTKPVESNDTPEGRARNRRTEFVLW
ncbi:MAG: OmpA family protein, partial [Saprospiraceae bacterium]